MSYNPVTIACTDGRRYTESVALTRSHWDYPLTREEWVGNFTANAESTDGGFDTGSRSPLEPEALALTMPLGEAMFTQRSIRKMRPDPTAETTHWNEWGGSAPWA